MAKSTRAPAKPRNVPVLAKPPPAKKARKPKAKDPGAPVPDRLSNISSLALDLSDELSELKETYRAFGCLESLLVPVEIQRSDEFYVTPTELRSLVALVHAEFGRRIDAVGLAVDAIQKASSTLRTAQAKVQTIKAKP